MKRIRIVRLSEKDTPQICEIDKAAFGPDYDLPPRTSAEIRGIFESGFALGIFENGKLVSSIQISEKSAKTKNKKSGTAGCEWYVHGVATLPEAQDRGLAGALLKEVIRLAKKGGVRRITATVRPGNERSESLFSKNGFVNAGLSRDHYGKGKDRFIFELLLA